MGQGVVLRDTYHESSDALAELQNRIDRLETRQHALLEMATTMRKTIRAWGTELSTMNVGCGS